MGEVIKQTKKLSKRSFSIFDFSDLFEDSHGKKYSYSQLRSLGYSKQRIEDELAFGILKIKNPDVLSKDQIADMSAFDKTVKRSDTEILKEEILVLKLGT